MYDYQGDMSYFQNQLKEKGITKEMFDMDRYCGLTARELQGIVDGVRRRLTIKTEFTEYKWCYLDVGKFVADGSLALMAKNRTDGPIARLTVCLNDNDIMADEAYVDTENCPWAVDLFLNAGIGKLTGKNRRSGYCKYPAMKFDMKKLYACTEV